MDILSGNEQRELDFHGLVWGKKLKQLSIEQVQSADMLVFGGVTYEGMAKHWPNAKGEIADFMNRVPQVVCSPTLKSADWNNTSIAKDAIVEIPKLKQGGTGSMSVFGSGVLSESPMKANLFDEYRICIVPVILGKGRHLFNPGLNYQKLKLLESQPLSSGGVILRYAPIRADGK